MAFLKWYLCVLVATAIMPFLAATVLLPILPLAALSGWLWSRGGLSRLASLPISGIHMGGIAYVVFGWSAVLAETTRTAVASAHYGWVYYAAAFGAALAPWQYMISKEKQGDAYLGVQVRDRIMRVVWVGSAGVAFVGLCLWEQLSWPWRWLVSLIP